MKKTLSVLTPVVLLTACAGSFDDANKKFAEQFDAGQYENAAQTMALATIADKEPNNIYLGGLQCGNGYLWANNTNGATKCFDAVNSVLSGEVEEDSSYKIKGYEKIMAKTYEGINAIAKQDEFTQQIFNQAYELQKSNIEDSGAEIESLRKEYAESQEKLQAAGISSMPSMDSIVSQLESQPENPADSVVPMKDFANPYTTWLMALYDGAAGDKSNAENGMNRVASFAPKNSFIPNDIDGLNNGSVYVVFENGKVGPVKKRSLVPDGLQVLTQPLQGLGISAGIELTIPDVFPGTKALDSISVTADNKTVETEFLASVDSIVKTDMDKYKTGNIIKSVVFEVGKIAAATAAGIAAHEAAKGSPFQKIATVAAVTAVMSVKKPWDLRSWDSIPNEIQTARVKMPADHKIVINDAFSVDIPEDVHNAIVFVRIPTANAKPGVVIGKLN